MLRTVFVGLLAAALLAVTGAHAQGTFKIGVILPYSGQFADNGVQLDRGIKLYMRQHGDIVAGRKIEVIRKDVGGIAPPVAKRLAQELIVRDKVDVLAGFVLTPNALAVGDVSAQAKKFMVVMTATTSIITLKSPYMARTSYPAPALNEVLGAWAYQEGLRKVYTMVSDFGPGHDAGAAFEKGFKDSGGTIVGSVRMPVINPDFSAFVQRAKDLSPEGIYVFVPGGAQPPAFGKALAERRIDPRKTTIMGETVFVDDNALKSMGDAALGIVTVSNYDYSHASAKNKSFVKAYNDAFGRNPDIFSIGGYDGMHLIYAALAKTGGNTDATALINAAKGMAWESPRGPMSIDPETRDAVQTVYIRRVEKVDGKLVNVEFHKVDNVKDPVKARMSKTPRP